MKNPPIIKPLTLALLTLSTTGILAACAPNAPEPHATESSAPPVEAAPTPSASQGSQTPVPVHISCDRLLPPEALYVYNPNLAPEPAYVPQPGTPFTTIAIYGGTTCAWINETSGSTLTIGIARPSQDKLDTLEANASSGTHIVRNNVDVYYSRQNKVGEVQAFTSTSWLVAQSDMFFSEEDAEPLIDAAQEILASQ